MNKTLISYCLFQTSIKPNKRDHDLNQYDEYRYWYNVPFLIYFWLQFNYQYDVIIYINSEIKNNKLYHLLFQAKFNYKNLIIKQIPNNFIGAMPTVYRMQPVFDFTGIYSTVFIKDIDSVPTLKQMSVIKYFQKSNYLINNIRSCDSHNTELCKIMAGLCGFKPFLLKNVINNFNFKNYYKYSNDKNWGCDQNLLIKYFAKSQLLKYFLQIRTNENVNFINNFNIKSLYINEINQFNICLQMKDILGSITKWQGQPVDSRQYNVVPYNSKIYKIINKNPELRQFYKL